MQQEKFRGEIEINVLRKTLARLLSRILSSANDPLMNLWPNVFWGGALATSNTQSGIRFVMARQKILVKW
jgi:hypothetical protein